GGRGARQYAGDQPQVLRSPGLTRSREARCTGPAERHGASEGTQTFVIIGSGTARIPRPRRQASPPAEAEGGGAGGKCGRGSPAGSGAGAGGARLRLIPASSAAMTPAW